MLGNLPSSSSKSRAMESSSRLRVAVKALLAPHTPRRLQVAAGAVLGEVSSVEAASAALVLPRLLDAAGNGLNAKALGGIDKVSTVYESISMVSDSPARDSWM